MRTFRLWLLLPVCLILGASVRFDRAAHSAAPFPRSTDRPIEKEAPFMAHFLDGSQVRVLVQQERLAVNTVYGRLLVPVRDISRIEFGQRIPQDTLRTIRAALVLLGSDSFEQRESASKKLLDIGVPAYRYVQEAARSKDPEVGRRAKEFLAKLEASHSADKLARKHHDVIYTVHFNIVGLIEDDTLGVQTAYFGKGVVRPNDLLQLLSQQRSNDETFTIAAAQYASPRTNWMETPIEVMLGKRLKITATGQIDMYPQAPYIGQYPATPAGANWAGGGRILGMPAMGQAGMLMGKIGKNGTEFAIGEKYEGEARTAGRLYLRIVASPWGNESSGEYRVTVTQK